MRGSSSSWVAKTVAQRAQRHALLDSDRLSRLMDRSACAGMTGHVGSAARDIADPSRTTSCAASFNAGFAEAGERRE